MQGLSRTLIQLNIATRAHHAAADSPWLNLMGPTVTRQCYIDHLIRVYGFEAPLEAAFRYTPQLGALVDLRARTRSGLLAQDLLRLGLSASRLADLPQRFTTFGSIAEALGWMYVIERSTLLHAGVRRYLNLRLPEVNLASSYLSACDGRDAVRWADLGNTLDSLAVSHLVTRQIVRAANYGFRALCDWFGGPPQPEGAADRSERKTPPAPGEQAAFLAEHEDEWSKPDRESDDRRLLGQRIRT